MTAEVLILRQNGITLSSDKAVTTPSDKSYTNSEKIFNLAEDFPAAMMINGYADFEGIFIGDLIGEFKKENNFKNIGNIEEIKNRFVKFLEENTCYTSKDEYLTLKLNIFKEEIRTEIESYGFEDVMKFYGRKSINSSIKNKIGLENEFDDMIPDNWDKNKWNLEIWEIFWYWMSYEGTNIIITGYNNDSYYPSFFEINIHCNDNGKLVYEEVDSRVNWIEPFIKIFAIKQEAYAFLTGVNEEFEEDIKNFIGNLESELINEMKQHLRKNNFKKEKIEKIVNMCKPLINNYFENIVTIIEKYKIDTLKNTSESIKYLPQDLICDFSSYLIQLTGLKQKLFEEVENVSIETDVGIITKSKNFKWYKQDGERFKY